MIHVDRDRVPMPSILGPDPNSRGKRELERAANFYSLPKSERRQRQFAFAAYKDETVKQALVELFHSKCAYCESRLSASQPVEVEHFRPKAAIDTGQRVLRPGYWWLASEWTNLYITCRDCGRLRGAPDGTVTGKGTRFPIMDENMRARVPGEEQFEEPLLLDPCLDCPEEHLAFREDGLVTGESLKGETTIAVLALNRRQLVEARRAAALRTLVVIGRVERLVRLPAESQDDVQWVDWLRNELADLLRFTDADQEFAGLTRQLVQPALERILGPGVELEWILSRWQQDFSLEDEEGQRKYRLQSHYIQRIEIHNVKAIRDLQLDLTASQSGRTPWMMLLGENATGKSTVLQAVALVLAGAKYFGELISTRGVRPSEYIRKRCKSGHVKVYLTDFPGPHMLTFRETSVEFKSPLGDISKVQFDGGQIIDSTGKSWAPQTLLLGYGATRLLPRKQETDSYGGEFARVDNLFDPFVPLVNASDWLSELPGDKLHLATSAVEDLLALGERDKLIRRDGQIWVKAHRATVPLESLSDGYQSGVALTADILEVVLRVWPTPELAQGIVLLDEIGSHIHPTWKMRIVSSLRRVLPGIQFIATTHQPLCLRGLAAGEVVVMRRDAKSRVTAVTELPSVEGLRVDQLLTSEHFGLMSTRSLETEELFTEYYDLLAKKKLKRREQERLVELASQLEKLRLMGVTRRERMMLTAIDKYLATEPEFLGTPEEQRRRAVLEHELASTLAE